MELVHVFDKQPEEGPQTEVEYFCSFLPPHFQCPGVPVIAEDKHTSGTDSLTRVLRPMLCIPVEAQMKQN